MNIIPTGGLALKLTRLAFHYRTLYQGTFVFYNKYEDGDTDLSETY
jgi:hypothetical protein